MIEISFQIDPHIILGLAPGASLVQIRDAYRLQAEKFHPDAGGADWMFRILNQAYEVLSTARVDQASRSECGSPYEPPNGDSAADRSEDAVVDRTRLVGVEKLWVRYESEPLWLMQESARDEHSLSCSLNFKWPDPTSDCEPASPAETERILSQLTGVFEAMCVKTRVDTSRIRVHGDSFTGWLSYPSVERAVAAYRLMHGMLSAQGFTVKQWNRDLLIPRTWR